MYPLLPDIFFFPQDCEVEEGQAQIRAPSFKEQTTTVLLGENPGNVFFFLVPQLSAKRAEPH